MAALGKRRILTKLVRWDSRQSPGTFEDRVNEALTALRERGACIVYIDYQQSLAAGTGHEQSFFMLVHSAFIVYEEAE